MARRCKIQAAVHTAQPGPRVREQALRLKRGVQQVVRAVKAEICIILRARADKYNSFISGRIRRQLRGAAHRDTLALQRFKSASAQVVLTP